MRIQRIVDRVLDSLAGERRAADIIDVGGVGFHDRLRQLFNRLRTNALRFLIANRFDVCNLPVLACDGDGDQTAETIALAFQGFGFGFRSAAGRCGNQQCGRGQKPGPFFHNFFLPVVISA